MQTKAEYQQEWRKQHPGYAAAYYVANKARLKAKTAQWRLDHPEVKYRTTPAASAQWRAQHPEYPHTQMHKEWRKQLRAEVLVAYGGHCQCCGETEPVFLDIDHIDGRAPEGEKKLRSAPLYRWLRKHGFPAGYRLLCRNCNWGVHVYLECPHTIG
jgi:hypothetical protein